MARPQAISKDEVLRQVPARVERWLEKAVLIIDAILVSFFPDHPFLTILDSTVYLGDLPVDRRKQAIAEIESIYTEAGWKVNHIDDEHFGSGWFTFS